MRPDAVPRFSKNVSFVMAAVVPALGHDLRAFLRKRKLRVSALRGKMLQVYLHLSSDSLRVAAATPGRSERAFVDVWICWMKLGLFLELEAGSAV